ncbi:MAG: carboxypeptidase-like regulatory domain-containing protein [Duncaniella sp.]|nr:carboxypeptidase-like regulatory domain-containing protein [Duncaniella sp.]
MKPAKAILAPLLTALSISLSALSASGGDDIIVAGSVKDTSGKKALAGASIVVPGSNIGTVTNRDGRFTLRIPDSIPSPGIRAEHIGYQSLYLDSETLTSSRQPLAILLTPAAKALDEVVVRGIDPRSLIESAIDKIPLNYPSAKGRYTAFYRETIQKGSRYVGVTEAVTDIIKNHYRHRSTAGDRVKIVKGRRLMSQRGSDTIAVKIVGGPTAPVTFDIVKNEDILFSRDELDYYDFSMETGTVIDDRPQYVVSFKPKVKVDYPLNIGKVWIDRETHTFTRAEFALDVSDKDKATRVLLYRKPRGLKFKPQAVEFTVTYRYQDGISYLNYISTRTRFKCDWRRRLFSSAYTASVEMVMIDRLDNPTDGIARSEAAGHRDIFYDIVDSFSDPDFWKDYNIIAPTESLEKAVDKLRKSPD